MSEPVTRPTAVRQWSRADIDAALAAGRPDLISAALDAGQLADLLGDRSGKPGQPMPSRAVDARDLADPDLIARRVTADAAARGITLPTALTNRMDNRA